MKYTQIYYGNIIQCFVVIGCKLWIQDKSMQAIIVHRHIIINFFFKFRELSENEPSENCTILCDG